MPLFNRTRSASPADLLEQARAAQDAHRAAIDDANQRLIESHQAVYAEADGRQAAITEQVKLLQAEHSGLDQVKAAATHGGIG